MKKNVKHLVVVWLISISITAMAYAGNDMAGHDMKGHDMAKSDRVGDLIHESVVDGYMLSYYFMDLRDQKGGTHDMADMDNSHSMPNKAMDKPHHLMVYIMDQHHQPVLKAKVGFLIKDAKGNAQKAMGMFMSNGFGITADMKKKGLYTITTKAIAGDKKLMDKFDYDMK
ncbi:hypothetical protein [Desulfobacula sp.]|uniref:hypothetical protein n=1 Tax=Desulfobacula sp. TaxID=2593537 RepID=UPI00262D5054|nr:hypothetical protein [Desulfobacula sp.]